MEWEERRPAFASGSTLVRREPVGVVGAIAPWNHPQALAMVKTAPALAAGYAVVLKPALETALDACVLVETAGRASAGRAKHRAQWAGNGGGTGPAS